MSKQEWQRVYEATLVKHGGFNPEFARETFEAVWGHDWKSDPREAAHDELSYWGND